MRFLHCLWRKLTQSKALEFAGPLEKAFFESVYRLSFITGLSTSDDNIQYTLYCSTVRIVSALVVYCEIWRVVSDNLSLDEIISSMNVIFIHLITIWKLMIMLKEEILIAFREFLLESEAAARTFYFTISILLVSQLSKVSNKRVFYKLAKALESPSFDISTQRRKNIVKYWANKHQKYLKVLLSLACLTLTVWYTYPLVDEVDYNLMVDVKVPVKYDSSTRYPITYLVVGIMFNYASFLVIMSEVIMQAHLIPLICQYDVLADCFEHVFEECAVEFEDIDKHELVKDKVFVDKYLKRLGDLVAQHREILDQTMHLKKILSAPMLGQLTCSGLLICFVGYQAATTIAENLGKFIMTLLYLGYNMFTLYLIAVGARKSLCSQRIGESAYFSGWESGMSLAPGARATIILVIARANKPLVFLAGGMYTLSLTSYTNLVKASYSALNILLTMSHE